MQFLRNTLPATLALILCALPGFSQDPRPVAQATSVDTPPVIDGAVDDAVWQLAAPITDFTQTWPVEGAAASEETVVRVLYTDTAVYVGAVLYDSDPDQILVTDSRRDSGMEETDSFQVILDTYRDLQNGFVFGTNPAGIEFDGQVVNEGADFNLNWDASWVVRTQVTDTGWSAEFEIPLRSLRYGSRPQVWGINFQRNIRRRREQAYWAPIERIYDLYRLSEAGELRGLDLETPRNFKVTPYVVSSVLRDYADTMQTDADFDADTGVDAKFGVTPSLNLDLTYNTDFAQVEVDEQVINLTRFNVRFPEKRPFFLENAGLFAAGKEGVDLFFSRRIGITSGVEVPIIGGARLSGKAGDYNVGVLTMQTDDVPGVAPMNNFSVARVTRELPNRSSLGGILVNRDATGSMTSTHDWNRTWGTDGRVGIGQYTDIRGFVARTETPEATGSEAAYNTRISYTRPGGNTNFEYTHVGDGFNPEVGFLDREGGYRSTYVNGFQNIRFPNVSWLRELRPHFYYETFWDLDGFKETETLHMDSHVDFESGWYISPAVNMTFEGLKAPFEISPGVVIPPGSYRNAEIDWRLDSDQSRALAFTTTWTFGGFYTGNQRTIELGLTGRYGSNVNASINWIRSDVELPQGDFLTNLLQSRFNYSFTPLINFESLVQYNDRTNNWSGNFRFGWQNTAGTGLFIVYNETHSLDTLDALNRPLRGEPQTRALIIKYSYQFDILR